MRLLRRKLFRDIGANRWLFIAVTSVVLLGVCLFDAAYMSFQNLSSSYDLAYRRLHFADFTTRFHRGPRSLVDRVRLIPGVAEVHGRLSEDLELALPGPGSQKVVGRVVSLPDRGQPPVNSLLLAQGRWPSPLRRELLLERNFAKSHHYRPGDTVSPVVLDDKVKFTVTGIAASPEYILAVRSKEFLMPTPGQFGVLFIPRTQAEQLLGAGGAINELCVTVLPGADRRQIIRAVEGLAHPYGIEETVTSEEQPSNNLLQVDLRAFREISIIFPTLFLAIGALTVYTLLVRMVHTQRTQIGFMRASGYSRREILLHYLEFALLLGVMGATAGTIAGYGMGVVSTHYYTSVVGAPFLDIRPRGGSMAAGWLAGMIAAVLAGMRPARSAAGLLPAEAMRTETPVARRTWALRYIGRAFVRLPYGLRLPLRNAIRRPRRSLYTALGVASAISLVIVSLGMLDASYDAINEYFHRVQLYDLRASFVELQPQSRLSHLAHWEGVQRVEPGMLLPVELERRGRSYSTLVLGLAPDSELYQLHDQTGKRVTAPENGMLVGATVREKLKIEVGDQVRVRLPREPPEVRRWHVVRIRGYVQQPVGSLVYMDQREVRRHFGRDLDLPPHGVTGVVMKVDPRYADFIRDRLYNLAGVLEIETTADTRNEIEELMKLFYAYIGIMLGFGIALSVAILFNTATIGVLERAGELASLRSLGMSRRRVGLMVTVENAVTAVVGSALGMLMGRLLDIYLVSVYASEQMELRPVIYPQSYAITVGAVFVALMIAQIPALRTVNRLDLAKATKETVS